MAIGLISVFSTLAYFVGSFAFRTDRVLVFLHRTSGSCRELTNESIIIMFCGIIFFFFAVLLTLGEFQRYVQFRQRGAQYQAKRALFGGLGWGTFAIGLAVGALVFFNQYCR
jgi:hypothetical protein